MRPQAWALGASLLISVAATSGDEIRDVPVCDSPGQQANAVIVADGRGGAIVAWADARGGGYDIFAQRLSAAGRVDPSWPPQGLVVCDAPDDQAAPTMVRDGRGGAIVAWYDQRGGKDHDLYAQHVLASGQVDPHWPKNGRALCTAPGHQQSPFAVEDSAGGAIVAWWDYRSGPDAHIYAQHVLDDGRVDPRWPNDGLALCVAPGLQCFPKAVGDGRGGAIVTWYDHRGTDYDIYAQHVLAAGEVDSRWPANGRALCTAAGHQRNPTLISDGAGGAIVAWDDGRRDPSFDVYAQHVLASGSVDPAFPDDGIAVAEGAGAQHAPALVPDGRGGALVVWEDEVDPGDGNLRARHLTAHGAIDPAWPAGGATLCAASGEQGPAVAIELEDGAIVAWPDFRNGTDFDLDWTWLGRNGATRGPSGGRALCQAPGAQLHPALARVAKDAFVACWEDARGGSESKIHAARVEVRPATSGRRRSAPRGSVR